jgi:succinate-acetate transporter protein
MSEEGSLGLNLAERFFGLLVLAIGLFTLYYTVTSADTLMSFTWFFGFLAIVLVVLGIVMITAKTE